MPQFQPRDPAYVERVSAAFRTESAASRWGSELTSVSPGVVEIALSFRDVSTGAPGMLHRSIVAALLDDACLLAALSLSSDGGRGDHRRIQAQLPSHGFRRRGHHPRRSPTPRPQYHRLPCRRLRRRAAGGPDAGHAVRVAPCIVPSPSGRGLG